MREHTKARAEAIGSFDGYVFVTAEYNHSVPAALKNALDFLYREWNNKATGFVSYGGTGGTWAVEHLRLIAAELQMVDVRAQGAVPLATEFENYTTFTPSPRAVQGLGAVFDQVIAWAGALKPLRRWQTPPGHQYGSSIRLDRPAPEPAPGEPAVNAATTAGPGAPRPPGTHMRAATCIHRAFRTRWREMNRHPRRRHDGGAHSLWHAGCGRENPAPNRQSHSDLAL